MKKDAIDNLFEQLPLEKPSVNFDIHIMELIQKEHALRARKAFAWKLFAIVIGAITCIISTYIFIVPYLILPLNDLVSSLGKIISQTMSKENSLYIMIFCIALFLLFIDEYLRRHYIKRKDLTK